MTRIEEVRKERGLSQQALAERTGCTRQAIGQYEAGVRNPTGDILVRMAGVLGVSSAYLLGLSDTPERDDRLPDDWVAVVEEAMHGGYTPERLKRVVRGMSLMLGGMEEKPDSEDISDPERPTPQTPKGEVQMLTISYEQLPILGRIRAGVPLLAEQHVIGHIEVPARMARLADFALEVSGDSMIGTGLQPGDYVFMRMASKRPPGHGDIVAAMVGDGEMTLKRYLKRNGSYWLHAENPAYDDIPVTSGVVIQGVYVGRFSEYAGTVDPPVDDMTEDELVTKLAQRRGINPDQLSGVVDALATKPKPRR